MLDHLGDPAAAVLHVRKRRSAGSAPARPRRARSSPSTTACPWYGRGGPSARPDRRQHAIEALLPVARATRSSPRAPPPRRSRASTPLVLRLAAARRRAAPPRGGRSGRVVNVAPRPPRGLLRGDVRLLRRPQRALRDPDRSRLAPDGLRGARSPLPRARRDLQVAAHAGHLGARARLQRAGGDRRERPVATIAALPAARGRRRQRRLDRRHDRSAWQDAFDLAPVRVALARRNPDRADTGHVRLATHRACSSSTRRTADGRMRSTPVGGRAPPIRLRHRRGLAARADALLKVAKPILDDPSRPGRRRNDPDRERLPRRPRTRHRERHPRSRLATIQVLEYLRAFLVARVGWSRLNALGIVSGAFGLFHRASSRPSAGTGRTRSARTSSSRCASIVICVRPASRTGSGSSPIPSVDRVPEQLGALGRQRRRWQRGLWEGMRRHARMIRNPRYGIVGSSPCRTSSVRVPKPDVRPPPSRRHSCSWILGDLSTWYFGAFLFVSVGLGGL